MRALSTCSGVLVLAAAFLVPAPQAPAQLRLGGDVRLEIQGKRGSSRLVVRAGFPRRHHVCVPGRFEVVRERIWIPGETVRVWVPPVYEFRCDFRGRSRRVLVAPGHYRTEPLPGRYEVVTRRVWRPGCCR